MKVYPLARVEVRRSTAENGDANHGESRQRPDERGFVEVREDIVHEGIDGETGDVVGDVDEELVPALGFVGLAICQKVTKRHCPRCWLTGFMREITPRTSWLPSNPPVATRATQPEQFTQPVIQERMGIHRSQETTPVSIRHHSHDKGVLTNGNPVVLASSTVDCQSSWNSRCIPGYSRRVGRKELGKRGCHAQVANTSSHQT